MKNTLWLILLFNIVSLNAQERQFDINILAERFGLTADAQSDYPLDSIMQGCPDIDCIPSIDQPTFIPTEQVDFLTDKDLILAVEINGTKRVYPALTLQRHEIVNDQIDQTAFAITFCPLCGTGVAFSREMKGHIVEFGVSGVLHGSDLVLYDRTHKNLFQQITGTAFAGIDRGHQLTKIPLVMTDWKTWKNQHPNSQVLSNSRDDLKDHYVEYRKNDTVRFGGVSNPRLKPKRVIYGIEMGGQAMAFDFEMIQANKKTVKQIGAVEILIQAFDDGKIEFSNNKTHTKISAQRSFWFAWYTFHPETLLFKD